MSGCRSTKQEIVLPPKPQRQEIQAPTNLQECAEIIVYYEYLVEEWEAWGEAVDSYISSK